MKKILLAIAAGAMLLTGCVKGLEDRVSVLEEKVASLEEVVAALNVEVSGISTIVSNLQKKVYVTGVEKIMNDTGVEVGYKISFTEGEPVIIYHGQTGPEGQPGVAGLTPSIDIFEGVWYWKYEGGDWILDDEGKKIPAVRNLDFEVGADGHLYVTIEGGSKIDLGNVTGKDGQNGAPGTPGDKGEPGDSWFDGVTVDETSGTVTISIKDSEHDIVLPLYQFTFKVTVPDGVRGIAGEVVPVAYSVCESAAASTVVRAYPSKGIEAEVDRENNVINVTLSTVDGYVDVYAINNATGDIKAQTVEFKGGEEILVGVKETEFTFAPDGTTEAIEIPVSTAVEYEVEAPSWITYEVKDATKAVRDEVITLSVAEANTTAKDYKGNVVLKDKDGKEIISFAVLQKNYYPELIADAEGKPIQWAESGTITASSPAALDGIVEIELSDDFSKGVYIVSNVLSYKSPYGSYAYKFYADVEGDTFTLKAPAVETGYYGSISADLEMTLSADRKQITYSGNKFGYAALADYALTPKADAGEDVGGNTEGAASVDVLVGDWIETYMQATSTYTDDEMKIEISDDPSKGQLKITMFNSFGYSTYLGTYYANLSADGKKLTVLKANSSHGMYNSFNKDIEMTVSEAGAKISWSGPESTSWGATLSNFVATKKEAAEEGETNPLAAAAVGTYTESYSSTHPSPGQLKIELSDDASKGDLKITFGFESTPFYATVAEGQYGMTKITVASTNTSNWGPVSASLDFVPEAGYIYGTVTYGWGSIPDYSASK